MKPVLTKIERDRRQADRGIGAMRLIDDENVEAYFAQARADLMEAMIAAETLDHDARLAAVLEIKALDRLKKHLDAEAALGRKAIKNMETRNV